jgi:hypothetical protein
MSLSCEKINDHCLTMSYDDEFKVSLSLNVIQRLDDESFNKLREYVNIEYLRRNMKNK